LQVVFVGTQKPAARVHHHDNLARSEQALRKDQRAKHVRRDESTGIAQDVRLSRLEIENLKDVDARVHAGNDGHVF
jgi:hypothetical protein